MQEYDLITVFHYLDRALFPALRAALEPGGALIFETFTTRQAESAAFPRELCLEPGELLAEAGDLEVLLSREGLDASGREVASLVAVKPLAP
jgi:hypothetical protein